MHNNVIQNLGIKHHNAMASNNTAYNALLEYNIVNGNHFFVLKINENVKCIIYLDNLTKPGVG